MLAALGVVFGDIGTSPLYSMRECFHGPHSIEASSENILGVLSLIFWSLVIVISVKYLGFILRADNRGEGGILALSALANRTARGRNTERMVITALGIFGAALLYGDGVITPAISVLSAVEGLSIVTPVFTKYVIPITCGIIVLIFMVQKNGTGGIGRVFGPVTLLWFLALAILGASWMVRHPSVLEAVNPTHAVDFFVRNGWHGFLVLGSVFLVVTGGEALYADMGHFGARPIRLIWFFLVLPSLLLNYFGQGALLLSDPVHAENPFYHLVPDWALIPMVILATAATCIASQAVISGAFSLTRQAVQLGYSPRVEIKHTSASEIGQIYVPGVNFALMVACIWLVLMFKTSSNLAAAYGIAVTATMGITTILFYFVAHEKWRWPNWAALSLCATFLVIDLAFFGANIVKVADGGWFPLALGLAIFIIMTTWKRGRQILTARHRESEIPQTDFIKMIQDHPPHRVPGTAVFMYRNATGVPSALLHNLKHNRVLHERVVFLTVISEEVPHVAGDERVQVTDLGHGFWRVVIHYGFVEDPDVPKALATIPEETLVVKPMETTYFLGRETIVATKRPGMFIWQERLFSRMIRNERTATSFFKLPPNRVVELGEQIEI
ncbi:MAG TPA: potassium transporter Kup [Candidatus Eisenbacteria bacterium]